MEPAYNFDSYLQQQSGNWFESDAFLQACLETWVGSGWHDRAESLGRLGGRLVDEYDPLARRAARPEHLPRLVPYDGYGRRVDTVQMAGETERLLQSFYDARPYRKPTWELYTRMFLYAQLGEAGTLCSAVCTDGLVRALRALGETAVHRRMLDELENGAHGAQFITEIQGGCDVGRNVVRAEPQADGQSWRLYGQKWFCSNIIADHFAVTARPEDAPPGGRGVALFVVPAWHESRRNGYRIDRLKEKLGTQNLPTAEVQFDGALAYSLGALDAGIANLLRYVISTSRFGCAIGAAGYLARIARDVELYADFREAFGQSIRRYPVIAREVEAIKQAARQLLAGCLRLWSLWDAVEAGQADARAKTRLRIMMMLNKMVCSRRSSTMLHRALLIFGGNGIDLGFTPASVFLRDSIVNEIWEGPHSLMLANALRDLGRAVPSYPVTEFVADCARSADAPALAASLEEILKLADPARSLRFESWAEELVDAWQVAAVEQVEAR